MKGTKLWQAAGSPIIQGRSRRQRPFWQQWLPAWIAAVAAVVWWVFFGPSASGGSAPVVAGVVVGAFLGAAAGVAIARVMGWRFPSVWGVIVGTGGAAALFSLVAPLLRA